MSLNIQAPLRSKPQLKVQFKHPITLLSMEWGLGRRLVLMLTRLHRRLGHIMTGELDRAANMDRPHDI